MPLAADTRNRTGKSYLQVRICINMTDEDVLLRAQRLTGMGHLNGPYIRTDNGKNNKPFWAWSITKRCDVLSLSNLIYAYMCSRRRGAIDVILDAISKTKTR